MIAKIIVDIKSKNVDKMYDYIIPFEYEQILEVGARVIVPFGQREIMGFCLETAETSDYHDVLKPIKTIIDMESYLTPELIDLAREIQKETSTLLITILETMLPAALKVVYRPKIEVVDDSHLPDQLKTYFQDDDQVLLEHIAKEDYPFIQKALKAKQLRQRYDIKPKNRSLAFKYIRRTKKSREKITPKQTLLLDWLDQQPQKAAPIKKAMAKANVSASIINTLEKNGYLASYYQEQYRRIEGLYQHQDKEIELNDVQRSVFDKIIQQLGHEHIFLLHGVTGSGKTEIYMKVIETVVKQGLSAIVLVPEIALTPMMMNRFKAKFGETVAMLHSGLSTLEKYDEWRRIIKGDANIVIGARSACFAPVDKLGLVVVDECHESSYKQETSPNYYAVDVLKKRINYHQAVLVMGSATPNIESYARQVRGYYELLELPQRALDAKMPEVEVVDMKQEVINGNQSSFSELLQAEMATRLERNEQTILLINRRGYANFVICRHCGYVFECPNCDISLVYHEYSHSLKCHYCGHDEKIPDSCRRCGAKDLRYMGSGTQKIETDIQQMFPSARVIRMDNDTTRSKNAHEKLLHDFQTKGDILLGTQMIAKGLDFPRVTLVGILQADHNLHVPDFRAAEKTFQLLMQVSGRSGRRDILGKVVVQAFNPDHYAIKYACNHDYLGFYQHEMNIRRLAKYAPFYYMIQLMVLGPTMRDVFYNGIEIVKHLKRDLDHHAMVLGPAIPSVKRIKNRYHVDILIKYKEAGNLNEVLNKVLENDQYNDNYILMDRFPHVG